MQTYRRFVSYVYQYENGKKAGNRGFIKVEARGNTCSIQISLKGICKDENASCSVYGFKREDGLLKGSLLAQCQVRTGMVQEQLVFPRNEMGRAKYGLQELSGIIFQGDDQTMYGTQWDDDPMKMENFQPDEKNEVLIKNDSESVEKTMESRQNWEEAGKGTWMAGGGEMTAGLAEETEPSAEIQQEYVPESAPVQDAGQEQLEENTLPEGPAEAAMPDETEVRSALEESVEENVPDETEVQSGAESAWGETAPDETEARSAAENMWGETVPDETEARSGEENVWGETVPDETEARSGEENVWGETALDETEIRSGEERVWEETVPDETEVRSAVENVQGETAPDETEGQSAAENVRGETVPDETEIQSMPESVWDGSMPDEAEARSMPKELRWEAVPEGNESGNIPEEGQQQEERAFSGSMADGAEDQNTREEQWTEAVPDETETPDISGNLWRETVPEDEMQDAAEISEMPEGLQAEIRQEGRIHDPVEPEELTKILDTTIPVQDLPRADVPSIHAAENQTGSRDQGNYIKQDSKNCCPFSDGVLDDCRRIKISDLRFLDSRDQNLRNNRFVQHGYQMFGHLLLARIARNGQYILGVPGMYQQQEKFMADMFGFHNFKYARRNGPKPSGFGYWYRLIYPPKLGRGNGRAK